MNENTFVASSKNATRADKKSSLGATGLTGEARFPLKTLAISLLMSFGANVYALPAGGVVTAGGAGISSTVGNTTITQSSQNVAINWQSFNIGQGEAVRFLQPNSSAVALNRVLGSDPSSILGSLSANGKVFLVNPNGILFGRGAQVNVGGLVASTLNITDNNFMAGKYQFSGAGGGTILNHGAINADGGYIALLGANVSNDGIILARLGTVALAAGTAITLDVAGDGLLNVTVNQGVVNALVQNGGLIKADGGQVLLTAQGAGTLMQSAVNNIGVIQAQTVQNHNGTIRLLGDMQNGTVNVGGTLDASAPNGGNGGFIDTSAAHVKVQDNASVTTAAAQGLAGTWMIDPFDFIIGPGGDISNITLSNNLVTTNVTISSNNGATGVNGDIFVNGAVSWTAVPGTSPTTLTLNAIRDVNLNSAITAVDGNLVVCCGRDINVAVGAPISATRGSVLLSTGRNANLNGAITTVNGNLTVCTGHDVNVNADITVTNGTVIPARSLGLSRGLVLIAGNDGTGPGVGGGTVNFSPIHPATVTAAPTTIFYNPTSYTTPTNYAIDIIGLAPTQFMLVFPSGADKPFDGTTGATFTGLKGAPAGVTLVAGNGSTATFNTPAVGQGKIVTFSGYSLAGPAAANFSLPVSCCAPVVQRTTANITAAVAASSASLLIHNSESIVPPLVSPDLNLGVIDNGIRMPLVELALAPPQEIVPVIVPPPPVYVPPPFIRKQDRN